LNLSVQWICLIYLFALPINLTLRQLEAFRAVARTLNFSQAATQVHLSQPALSATIRKLEDVIGGRLFDRNTRNVALTHVGTEVVAIADRLLGDFDAAFAGVRAFLDGKRGRVAVAASPSLAADFVPEVVAAFQHTHPLVELQVHDALSDDAIALVRTKQADLALAPETAVDTDLANQRLFRDYLVLVCRRDHALAKLPEVTWKVLLPFGLVTMKSTSSIRHLVEQTYVQHGVAFRPAFEVEYATTLISFVARGLGIGILPFSLVSLLESSHLTHRRIRKPEIYRTLCVIRLKSRTPSPAADAFIQACLGQSVARRKMGRQSFAANG
jgi:DNA-binding transcriptional LysR family regulator